MPNDVWHQIPNDCVASASVARLRRCLSGVSHQISNVSAPNYLDTGPGPFALRPQVNLQQQIRTYEARVDACIVDTHPASCDCCAVSNRIAGGFGVRLKAGHQFLVLIIEVRILYPEPPERVLG